MKNQKYNQEFDVFETPNDLWSNIESKLDKPARKKRRIVYWSAAAAAILVTVIVFNYPTDVSSSKKNSEILANGERTEVPYQEQETGQQKNQVIRGHKDELAEKEFSYNKIEPAGYDMATVGPGTVNLSTTYSASASGNNGLSANVAYISQSEEFDGRSYGWTEPEVTHGSTYEPFRENDFIKVATEAQSTFSIDVDGASYSDVRGMIGRNTLPHPDAVRLEEFINYFPYNYSEPNGDRPFSTNTEVVDCPWNTEHKLMKIGIKGESISNIELPSNNLVFLLDVSGSMMSEDKLELLKKGFALLVQELREQDRVSICVYAGAAGMVLPPTSGAHKDKIMDALNQLEAGGSTAGGQGIELAYATAQKHFDPDGNNRVILATDGDFNVGTSNDDALVKLIEEKRKSGVFLTVLGFGYDNFQASKMEKLANNGNGNFSFIDNILEAKKVLVTEMGGTLKTIAKDVKIQLEFNSKNVERYRLIGYENRMLNNEDFANDAVDAGELGAGHTVTAVYEVVPTKNATTGTVKSNKNGVTESAKNAAQAYFNDSDWATLKFRYKAPNGSKSKLIQTVISNNGAQASSDMQFIQAVIEFGLILRNSQYKGSANYDRILKNARLGLGLDPYGYRSEFIQIVKKAQQLSSESNTQ